MVGEDDELSHEDGESEFFGFAGGEKTLIEGSKDGVVAGGDQGAHGEDRTHLGAPAGEASFAAELAAVAIEGSDSGESRRFVIGEGAEFGHEGDEGSGGEGADALDLLQTMHFGADLRGIFDQSGHETLQNADLLLKEGDGGGHDPELLFVGESQGEILVLRDLGERMGAVLDQAAEPLLEGIGPGEELRLESAGKVSDDLGLNAVGFGEAVAVAGEIADLTGIDLDDGATGRMS